MTLAARFAKNRKTKVQPLPADVAAALRAYLTGKPENALVWGGTWASGCTGAEMLRRDLEAVGIAYAVEGPDGPEYADFHSLRHTYLTMLGRHGVDLRTAQELAGHSTPLLTARYSHRRLYDLSEAVNKLPNLVPTTGPNAAEIPLRSTGTEGAKSVVPGVVPGVVTGGAGRHQSAPKYTVDDIGWGKSESPQVLGMQGAGASQHRPASHGIELPGQDSNLDKESQNLNTPRHNINPESILRPTTPAGRSAGRSGQQGEGGGADADLAALVAAWPTLSEPIKAAIRALIGSAAEPRRPAR